jgi:hypothetical protein
MSMNVLTLERTGLIRRQPGVSRSIEVLVAPGLTLTRFQPIKALRRITRLRGLVMAFADSPSFDLLILRL